MIWKPAKPITEVKLELSTEMNVWDPANKSSASRMRYPTLVAHYFSHMIQLSRDGSLEWGQEELSPKTWLSSSLLLKSKVTEIRAYLITSVFQTFYQATNAKFLIRKRLTRTRKKFRDTRFLFWPLSREKIPKLRMLPNISRIMKERNLERLLISFMIRCISPSMHKEAWWSEQSFSWFF